MTTYGDKAISLVLTLSEQLDNLRSEVLETMNSFLRLFSLKSLLLHVAFLSASSCSNPPEPIGIYNSSVTPSNLPWNTYNYCNAPHVNSKHYDKPTNVSDSTLVYMNVMIRHHKVNQNFLIYMRISSKWSFSVR